MSDECLSKFKFSLKAHMPSTLNASGINESDERELYIVKDIPVFELEHRPQFVYKPIKKEPAYYTPSVTHRVKSEPIFEPTQPVVKIEKDDFDDNIIQILDSPDDESDYKRPKVHEVQNESQDPKNKSDIIEIVLSDSDNEPPPVLTKKISFLFYKIRCLAALSSSKSIFVETPICLIFDTDKRRFALRWVQNVHNYKSFIDKNMEDIINEIDTTTIMWTSMDIISTMMQFKQEPGKPFYIRLSQCTILNLHKGDYFNSDGMLFLSMHETDEIFNHIKKYSKNVKLMDESSDFNVEDKQVKWVLSLCFVKKTLRDYNDIKNKVLRAFFQMCSKNVPAPLKKSYSTNTHSSSVPVKDVTPGWIIDKTFLDVCCLTRLEPTSYLDDSIIDFFCQFIYNYVMCERQRQDWHIMNCFFLRKLSQYKSTQEAYNDTKRWLKNARRPMPYKKYIFIPVNLHGTHWSLALICHPYKAIRHLPHKHRRSNDNLDTQVANNDSISSNASTTQSHVSCFDFDGVEIPSPDLPTYLCPDTVSNLTSEFDAQCSNLHKSWCYDYFKHNTFEDDVSLDCISVNSSDEPCNILHRLHTHELQKIENAVIVYLDSLEGSYLNSKTLLQLRDHLYYDFCSRKNEFGMQQFEFLRSKSAWQYTHIVNIPKQQNGYDCGIFLIEYILYLTMNPQVIELELLSPSQDISTRLNSVSCCSVCSVSTKSLQEKRQMVGPSLKGCTCIDISKRTWFTQEYISTRRKTLIEMINYMKSNPDWPNDEERIEYLANKLTYNYTHFQGNCAKT